MPLSEVVQALDLTLSSDTGEFGLHAELKTICARWVYEERRQITEEYDGMRRRRKTAARSLVGDLDLSPPVVCPMSTVTREGECLRPRWLPKIQAPVVLQNLRSVLDDEWDGDKRSGASWGGNGRPSSAKIISEYTEARPENTGPTYRSKQVGSLLS